MTPEQEREQVESILNPNKVNISSDYEHPCWIDVSEVNEPCPT